MSLLSIERFWKKVHALEFEKNLLIKRLKGVEIEIKESRSGRIRSKQTSVRDRILERLDNLEKELKHRKRQLNDILKESSQNMVLERSPAKTNPVDEQASNTKTDTIAASSSAAISTETTVTTAGSPSIPSTTSNISTSTPNLTSNVASTAETGTINKIGPFDAARLKRESMNLASGFQDLNPAGATIEDFTEEDQYFDSTTDYMSLYDRGQLIRTNPYNFAQKLTKKNISNMNILPTPISSSTFPKVSSSLKNLGNPLDLNPPKKQVNFKMLEKSKKIKSDCQNHLTFLRLQMIPSKLAITEFYGKPKKI